MNVALFVHRDAKWFGNAFIVCL